MVLNFFLIIKIQTSPRLASVVITLDMETIQALQLYIDAYKVKEAILQTKNLKLKEQHVIVLNPRKLEVVPQVDKSELHFDLHTIKKRLSMVVVSGIDTIERVIVNKDDKEKKLPKYNLFVEGMGLLAVMGIEGEDGCETKSNHIIEVLRTLGIEAARTCIIDEIRTTMSSHDASC